MGVVVTQSGSLGVSETPLLHREIRNLIWSEKSGTFATFVAGTKSMG